MAPKIASPTVPTKENSGKGNISSGSELILQSNAQKMQQRLTFKAKPSPLPKDTPMSTLLKKIPLLSGFLRSVDHAGNSLSSIAKLHGNTSDSLQSASAGFQWAGLALSIVDFIRIPLIYGAALLVGEKPPITLSKNARWLYSGVLLGLTITALSVSVAAAPIALTIASMGLGVSLFTMGKMLYRRNQLRKELNAIDRDIAAETSKLNDLRLKTIELENELQAAEIKHDNVEEVTALRGKLAGMTMQFDALFDKSKQERLDALYDKKFKCENQLKGLHTTEVINRSIAVGLAAVALTGLVVSLFFPPVGLAIVAASAIAGGVYMLARAAPSIIGWFSRVFSNKSAPEVAGTSDKRSDLSHSAENKNELLQGAKLSLNPEGPAISQDLATKDAVNLSSRPVAYSTAGPSNADPVSSTIETMRLLYGKEGLANALHKQIENQHKIDGLQHTLSAIVDQHDERALLTLFLRLASSNPKITTADLNQYFGTVDDPKNAIKLLHQSVADFKAGELQLTLQEKTELLACSPLVNFLHEKGIELQPTLALEPVASPDAAPSATNMEQEEPTISIVPTPHAN